MLVKENDNKINEYHVTSNTIKYKVNYWENNLSELINIEWTDFMSYNTYVVWSMFSLRF